MYPVTPANSISLVTRRPCPDDIRGDERSDVGVNILPNKALAVTADVAQVTAEPGALADVGLVVSSVGRYAIAGSVASVNAVGLDVVSVDAGGAACAPPATPGAMWTCNLGTLESGATRHIHVAVRGTEVGSYFVGVQASSPEDDNSTTPQADTNVTIAYAFDMQVESPGEAVGYDHREFEVNLIVGALGTDASTHVVARVALPDEVAAVAAEPQSRCVHDHGRDGGMRPRHRRAFPARGDSTATTVRCHGTVLWNGNRVLRQRPCRRQRSAHPEPADRTCHRHRRDSRRRALRPSSELPSRFRSRSRLRPSRYPPRA